MLGVIEAAKPDLINGQKPSIWVLVLIEVTGSLYIQSVRVVLPVLLGHLAVVLVLPDVL